MEHTVHVPVDVYLAHYTDILHAQADTDALISYVEAGLRVKDLTATGWRDLDIPEDNTFEVLEEITENIHDLCVKWNEWNDHPKIGLRTTRLICRPSHETRSDVRGGFMKTEGRNFLLRLEDGSEVDDENVPISAAVAIAEFKCFMKDRAENEGKVVESVTRTLYNDPCRRFMLAFTIEGQMMRFWYFSRSHISVSAEFDFQVHPRHFIRFIIFLTFAPLQDLGYDPTAEGVFSDKQKIQYRFKVRGILYQTLRPLNEPTLDILSHATRVWEVVELDESNMMPLGEPKVLKDVWVYTGTKGEREIYDEIFTALGELDRKGAVPGNERPPPLVPGASLVEDAQRYFMTIVSDEVVVIDGQPDTARGPQVGYTEFIYSEGRAQAPSIPVPKIAHPHKERTHRRIIFKEVCQTMYQISNPAEFTLGLSQVVYGLDYMRLAGFVHRDLSPGNCLMYNGQAKISDLEYTLEYLSQGSLNSAPPTGTPAYMASEYQLGRYVFQPVQPIPKPLLSPAPFIPSLPVATVVPFRFNYLHDLESVLWMYLWFLLSTLPDSAEHLRHQLFDDGSTKRHFFISCHRTDSSAFDEVLAIIGADSDMAIGVNCFRFLAYCYETVEATEPISAGSDDSKHWDPKYFLHEYYVELHEAFKYIHGKMKDSSSSGMCYFVQFHKQVDLNSMAVSA